MKAVRVVVVGAEGRLGAAACGWIEAAEAFELVGRVCRGDSVERVCESVQPLLALEVTVAGLGAAHGMQLLRAGVRPVIGTSGTNEVELRELDALALELGLGGLVVPNFSLGATLLAQAAELVARNWAGVPTIVETHHDSKRDSPSGTAVALRERLRIARIARAADGEGPQLHSLRVPAAAARHEVRFSGEGEELVLDHRATDVVAYRSGVLLALEHALTRRGVAAGLEVALNLRGPESSA